MLSGRINRKPYPHLCTNEYSVFYAHKIAWWYKKSFFYFDLTKLSVTRTLQVKGHNVFNVDPVQHMKAMRGSPIPSSAGSSWLGLSSGRFTPGKEPRHPLNQSPCRHQRRSGHFAPKCIAPIGIRNSDCPAPALVTVPTESPTAQLESNDRMINE